MAPPTPSRKPRKKHSHHHGHHQGHSSSSSTSSSPLQPTEFPLVSLLWPAKNHTHSQWLVIPLIVMAAVLFRWSTSLWPYSGFKAPPMHGDFEAQRHWMEITAYFSPLQWYFHDLKWWGLDYPPLTAYHSWVLGKLGNILNPTWFAFRTSRGLDDPGLKLYMRSTVLASELLTYIPPVVFLIRKLTKLEGISPFESYLSLTAILFLPSIILIDHGHFQYNTVMLGLSAASIAALLSERHLIACFFFVGALGFKQMALFYAPAMFAYLLGKCVFPINITRFISIAIVTVLSFGILFAPLLLSGMYASYTGDAIQEYSLPPLLATVEPHLPFKIDKNNILHIPLILLAQSIHRIFPFARGLFEDKVANFWCALHTFHKLHRYSGPLVQKAALLGTLASILPPCLVLFLKPRRDLILLGLAGCSWGFFLFSYQVHEKNVLLPLLPMSLVLAMRGGLNNKLASQSSSMTRAWVGLANALGTFTMYPLLKRDGLTVPYFVLVGLWQWLLGLPPFSLSAYTVVGGFDLMTLMLHIPFYLGMVLWHIAETIVPPPSNKPDIWTVGNVLLGAAGFGLCYLWCLVELVRKSGILGFSNPAVPKKVAGSEKKTQ